MDKNQTKAMIDHLRNRREHVAMTLRHLHREYEQVEGNTEWLDQAAYENRTALLDRLNEWYLAEMQKIDSALDRFDNHAYGSCLACHQFIDPTRLKIVPETEYCAACEEVRESVEQCMT